MTVTALIAAVDQKYHALITSAAYAFRGTGGTIGVAVCSPVFQNILQHRLWEEFGRFRDASEVISRLRNSLTAIKYLPRELSSEAQEVYMDALKGVFLTLLFLAGMGTVASLFMKEYTLHKDMARRRA